MKNIKKITLLTKHGEIPATIVGFYKSAMVAEFVINNQKIQGEIHISDRILYTSKDTGARIKESVNSLLKIYDSCFTKKCGNPYLKVEHDGERMVRDCIITNKFTGKKVKKLQTIKSF